MIKRKSVTLMAAALSLGFGGTAIAEDAAKAKAGAKVDAGVPGIEVDRVPGDRVGIPGIDVDITTRIGGLDKDGDKLITKVEAKTDAELSGQFTTLDKNKDGKLDKAEYALFKADVKAKKDTHGAKVSEVARDNDKGGVPGIDADRVPGDRTGVPGVDVDITAKKDTHGDKVSATARTKEIDDGGVPGIDVDRVPGDRVGVPGIDVDLTTRIGKLDKDSDKLISKAEAKADAKLSKEFSKLDKNKDGKLDEGEFAKFEAKVESSSR